MLRNNSVWEGLQVSACLMGERDTDCPLSQTTFPRTFAQWSGLEDRESSSGAKHMFVYNLEYGGSVSFWSKKQICLLSIKKKVALLNSGFHSCNTVHWMYKCNLALYHVVSIGSTKQYQSMLMLCLILLLHVIKYPWSLSPESLVFLADLWNCGRLTS